MKSLRFEQVQVYWSVLSSHGPWHPGVAQPLFQKHLSFCLQDFFFLKVIKSYINHEPNQPATRGIKTLQTLTGSRKIFENQKLNKTVWVTALMRERTTIPVSISNNNQIKKKYKTIDLNSWLYI